MLSIKRLDFDETSPGEYKARIGTGYHFLVEETNGFYDVFFCNSRILYNRKVLLASSLVSMHAVMKECEEFLDEIFKNSFEIK